MNQIIQNIIDCISSWAPIGILMNLWNGFFNSKSDFYYQKLPGHLLSFFQWFIYHFKYYYFFLMDLTIGQFQINYVEPFKQELKVIGEGITLAVALFELIDHLPKEQQKGLMIASLILVAMHMERRMEQLEREKEEQLVKEVL